MNGAMNGTMGGFDWPALMRAGMRGLGLRPAEFWGLTPAELMLLLGRDAGAPLTRARLEEMSRAFPDSKEGLDNGGSIRT